jgi:hypothetical protein
VLLINKSNKMVSAVDVEEMLVVCTIIGAATAPAAAAAAIENEKGLSPHYRV